MKTTKGFKKALKHNGVHMGPKNFKIKSVNDSAINPVTGIGTLSLKGKLKFRGHGKKLVAGKLTAKIGKSGGNVKGKVGGKKLLLMRLRSKTGGVKVTRNGFGADLSRISARLSNKLAKAVNKKLGLSSLVASRKVAQVTATEQPETVEVLGGTASTTGASSPSPALAQNGPYPVAVKFGFGHCVNGQGANGISPIDPATQPGGPGTTIFLPVTGGTISPTADDGNVQQGGGVKINKNIPINSGATGDCTNGGQNFPGTLDQTNQVTRLGEKDVQSTVNVAAAPPGFAPTGNVGTVIGQSLDTTNTVVSADPANMTISTTGTLVKITETSAMTLNGIFPCVNNNPLPTGVPCDNAADPNTAIFRGGDLFGTSTLTVTVR